MLKREITYEDYNGVERTEEFWFHMSKAELMKMQLTTGNGLDGKIKGIVKAKSQTELEKFIFELLVNSYGKKSDDGRLFVKNDAVRAEFMASPAYDIMYTELFTSETACAAFIEGILPKDLREAVKNAKAVG